MPADWGYDPVTPDSRTMQALPERYGDLNSAIEALEYHRAYLGDEIVDTAVEYYRNIPRTTTPERFRKNRQPYGSNNLDNK